MGTPRSSMTRRIARWEVCCGERRRSSTAFRIVGSTGRRKVDPRTICSGGECARELRICTGGAEVSQKANERLLNALAKVDDTARVEELTADIQKHTIWQGRRVRALRPWGEDYTLCQAILHGAFLINGFRNRDLQGLLYDQEAAS